jgi:hypothetical protein
MSETMKAGLVMANGKDWATETAGSNDKVTECNRERRLRRRARRLGFILNKRRGFSTCHGPNYWLLDDHCGNPVLHDNGDPRNRATLDDVEAYLDKAEEMERNFDWDKAIFGR